jgi:N utilization substance protein A
MNKEILLVVDAVSNEKSVDKEIIFDALEAALASATRKKHGEEWDVRVSINRKTGDTTPSVAGKCLPTTPRAGGSGARELRFEDALDLNKSAEVGGFVEEPMESVAFGRIAAQQAKQVIVQKVPAERRRWWMPTRTGSERWCPAWPSASIAMASMSTSAQRRRLLAAHRHDSGEIVKSQDRISIPHGRALPRGPQLFLTHRARVPHRASN